jgi:hypothetical protein
MAKKKGTTSATPKATKRAAKKAAPKGATAQTAAKAGTPKAKKTTQKSGTTAAAGAKKKAAKKAPAVKLTDKQRDLLQRVSGGGATGFTAANAAEQRQLDALQQKKLIKKGAKDKASGKVPFSVTKAGEKALATAPASAS